MSYAAALRRAARFSPAWKPAILYRPLLDGAGRLLFEGGTSRVEEAERTLGARNLARDDDPARLDYDDRRGVRLYEGNALLTIITGAPVTDAWFVALDGTPYAVTGVRSADAFGATVRLTANAITADAMTEALGRPWPDP